MGEESTRLRLRVTPGARRAAVVGRHGDAWKVNVAARPEHGRANDALVELLAQTLAVPRGRVSLISGHGARDKVVEVSGIDADEMERRLESAEREDPRR